MKRTKLIRAGTCIVFVCVLAMLSSACGSKRKKYLEQVTPLVEMNDRIDAKVAHLPTKNAYKDPDYLQKLDGYIAQKEALRSQMELIEPPLMISTTHDKLLIAMNNGIRYLNSEREKFVIAAENIEKNVPNTLGQREEFDIIRQYYSQSAAYQADMKEQLMKKQYDKLYWEVKDELERARKF